MVHASDDQHTPMPHDQQKPAASRLAPALTFTIHARDPQSAARVGTIQTPHGDIPTPIYMPVGTQASVKAVTPAELETLGAKIILSNTYHLLLRPGPDLIASFGGLHDFMQWQHPILTDSGGFQVFSLGHLRKLTEEGVRFRSHLDGSELFLTPERVVAVEEQYGADIILPLDECLPYPTTPQASVIAMERTHRWAERALAAKRRPDQALFGITQGAFDASLRSASARFIGKLPFPGFSIGGLSVGEPKELMWPMLEATIAELPDGKPRHLLGVGSPEDLLEGVARGVDMFDCVLPTRTARNGGLYTRLGRVNIRASRFRPERGPIEPGCDCATCQTFSAGYLHHLARAGELLYYRLGTIHNLRFMARLMEQVRQSITEGRFTSFKEDFLAGYKPVDEQVREAQRRKWQDARALERSKS
jgi:queuine tRNA-ribosyltransferase